MAKKEREKKEEISADGSGLPTRCDPAEYERKWYDYWQERGLFSPSHDGRDRKFSMVIPPPNVTGSLHMGHALNITVQDALLRYHTITGDDCLWVPGMDHAGIATQNVVEKQLMAEGKGRRDLGREKFVERVWEWKGESHGNIKRQLEKLGAGADWTRERFTMDEECSTAVRHAFKTLFDEGLIHQASRIINWCPRCKTALSDIEVEYSDEDGAFYHLKYPVADGSGDFLEIATTRPETMLGDSAVAVHPDDERYAKYHGKKCTLPLVGREMPIILDKYVDVEMGTGALKVTPAHDPNDFELGARHDLPQHVMMTDTGVITDDYPAYAGLDRFECRKKIVEDLKAGGWLIKIEPHRHSVGHCYRCAVVIEPYISLQWFVKMKELAAPAIKAVLEGDTKFVPERWGKVYLDWLENIRDWCISRQLWWGHRIPVWTCGKCGKMSSAIEDLKACPECSSTEITQDEDVLDTWFSSGLWPLSTLGWPDAGSEDFKAFYPTSVLVTGFDIIFFWVARMMFFGLKFGNDVPFKHVYIHGLVRDEKGKKMSKSFGNVIDPLTICDEFGTDALRVTFLNLGSMGQDVNVSEDKFRASRNFCTKLWNAARYILMSAPGPKSIDIASLDAAALDAREKWLLSRVKRLSDDVRALMDGFDLNEAVQRIYAFVWHDFCDRYIEMSKPALRLEPCAERDGAETCLHAVLRWTLSMLHPFAPYITEEIHGALPGAEGSLLEAGWPKIDWAADEKLEKAFSTGFEIVREIRDMLKDKTVSRERVYLKTDDAGTAGELVLAAPHIKTLTGVKNIEINADTRDVGAAASGIAEGVEIIAPRETENSEEDVDRLNKKLAKLKEEIGKVESKLGNESFTARAPADVVEKEREKYNSIKADINKVEQRLGMTGG